jgi:hypothetical protein
MTRLRRERQGGFPARAAPRASVLVGTLAAAVALLLAGQPAAGARVRAGAAVATLGWQELTNAPPFDPGAMYLLTDGTVMVQALASGAGSPDWWRLTPDSSGSYVDGTWSRLASLPSDYGPGAYAAAVLPDGRLAVEGAEFNNDVETWSNLGAIYDPLANAWTMVSPPSGWTKIGDAPSVVLADGRWLLGDSGSWTTDDAVFDPSSLTWRTTGGAGKAIGNAEAGFTLLPSGKVLTVDALPPACTTRSAEMLDPATLAWSSAGATPTPLVVCDPSGGEIGPQILMDDGDVFAEGWTSATALYDTTSGEWTAGPDFPVISGQQTNGEDSSAAVLPDGKVLVATRTGTFQAPTHYLLFDGTSFTQAPDNASSGDAGLNYMLVLPTGQVLFNGQGPLGLEIFTDPGSPIAAAAPSLTGVYPARLAPGVTYQLEGLQLNGLSEGSAFGDDYQSSTDYPLVQITNDATGDVVYARTSGMTNRSIAPGASSCTDFTLPAGIEAGTSELRVIADGIPSVAYPVTVGAGGSRTDLCPDYTLALEKTGTGSGTVTTSAAGIDCGATCSHSYPNGTILTVTPAAAPGSAFAGWSGGGCSGIGPCAVTMDGDTAVTATFDFIPETLSVSEQGDGKGTVTSSPAGIDCGATCAHIYPQGTSVTLTAAPAAGSIFAGWSGAGCSGTGTCVVAMSADTSVTASFGLETLSVAKKGDGKGTVTSSPAGIDCGATCSHDYPRGTGVTLKAAPASGSMFAGWSGAGCSGTRACTVTMSNAARVSSTFYRDCAVPKVGGKSLAAARHAIRVHDCRLGKVRHAFSSRMRRGHVIAQKPKPHKRLSHGAKIDLVVSKGKKP